MRREVVVATRNKKKYKEIKRLFRGCGISVSSLERFPDVPEVIEDGMTFAENAAKKALAVSKYTDKLVIADDSGLEVDSLGGLPGVNSARYAGHKKDDRLNIVKLLRELDGRPPSKRKARFRCAAALARQAKLIKVIEARCEGRIGFDAEGSSGFGYDPVFIPKGYSKSLALLGPGVKDTLSHRSKAFSKAKRFIEGYFSKGL